MLYFQKLWIILSKVGNNIHFNSLTLQLKLILKLNLKLINIHSNLAHTTKNILGISLINANIRDIYYPQYIRTL
jgi:hypothetical protein